MRILVVDDDAAVRESLRRALGLESYEVELAADGAEALARLRHDLNIDAATSMRPASMQSFSTSRCRAWTGSRSAGSSDATETRCRS